MKLLRLFAIFSLLFLFSNELLAANKVINFNVTLDYHSVSQGCSGCPAPYPEILYDITPYNPLRGIVSLKYDTSQTLRQDSGGVITETNSSAVISSQFDYLTPLAVTTDSWSGIKFISGDGNITSPGIEFWKGSSGQLHAESESIQANISTSFVDRLPIGAADSLETFFLMALSSGKPFDVSIGSYVTYYSTDPNFPDKYSWVDEDITGIAKISQVPVPAALWLMSSALVMLIGVKKMN